MEERCFLTHPVVTRFPIFPTAPETGRHTMNRTKTLAAWIAETADWAKRAQNNESARWGDIAQNRLAKLVDLLPSGSGIDSGTELISADATKIVLSAGYHHMNENGYYDGWTEHKITIRAQFGGIAITIGGRDRNQIKDYLHETYHAALSAQVTESVDPETREATYRDERYASPVTH